MRLFALLPALLLLQACATSGLRDEPDFPALQSAIEAAARGDAEQAAALADSATARCAPRRAGFACALSSRMILANRFAILGDRSLALSQASSAVSLADEYGDAFAQWPALLLLAAMAAQAEQLEEAEAALVRAEAALTQAEAAILEEDEEATPGTRAALEVARSLLQGPQASIYMLKGEPALAAQSQAELVRALQLHDPTHPNLQIELLTLADIHYAAGDTESAILTLEAAAAMAEERGDTTLEREIRDAIERLSESE